MYIDQMERYAYHLLNQIAYLKAYKHENRRLCFNPVTILHNPQNGTCTHNNETLGTSTSPCPREY